MRGLTTIVIDEIEVSEFVSTFNEDNNLHGDNVLSVKDFLDFTGDTKQTNRQRIISTYTPEDKKEWLTSADPTMIKPDTTVITPLSSIVMENQLIYGKSQFLEQRNFKAYFTEYQSVLQNSDGYFKLEELTTQTERVAIDTQIMNLNVRVWIYSKVLGQLIDVSPLVSDCETSKDFSMGSFSISLNPIKSLDFDVEYPTAVHQKGMVNLFNLLNNQNGLVEDFFEKNIQYNDLVFVRFERLQMEKDDVGYESGQVLKLSSLANPTLKTDGRPSWYRVWDMVGLVDAVSTNTTFTNLDKSTTIGGRDFMKLLSEDGAYFYPYKYISGGENKSIWMGDQNSSVFKRNILTGKYEEYFFNYRLKSIKEYLGFVINHLSNLGVVPNNVFGSYGDRLSKLNKVPNIDEEDRALNGVWSIIKLYVDEVLDDRVFSGDLGNPDGTLLDFFNRACQYPFVEFFGDTWIDTFNFIIRQPPFTGSVIRDIINDEANYITVENKDVLSINLGYDNTYYSWYQVTPSDVIVGEIGKLSTAFIPIIFFPQIAEVFGNKRFQISDAYIYVGSLKGKEHLGDISSMTYATLSDLLFLIESYVYLPFTRRGTIRINGDRRIKVGTFIRLDATDELFYVTQVSNSLTIGPSIDRTTTITVERGMKWNLIKGEETGEVQNSISDSGARFEKQVRYSYFDIVNIEEIKQSIIANWKQGNRSNFSSKVKSDFGINKAVFDYMLNRRYLEEREG